MQEKYSYLFVGEIIHSLHCNVLQQQIKFTKKEKTNHFCMLK